MLRRNLTVQCASPLGNGLIVKAMVIRYNGPIGKDFSDGRDYGASYR